MGISVLTRTVAAANRRVRVDRVDHCVPTAEEASRRRHPPCRTSARSGSRAWGSTQLPFLLTGIIQRLAFVKQSITRSPPLSEG